MRDYFPREKGKEKRVVRRRRSISSPTTSLGKREKNSRGRSRSVREKEGKE